jgi:hypothetical protein
MRVINKKAIVKPLEEIIKALETENNTANSQLISLLYSRIYVIRKSLLSNAKLLKLKRLEKELF